VFGEIPLNIEERLLGCSFYPETAEWQTDSLRRSIDQPFLLVCTKAIESELQGRGAAVDTEDNLLRRRIGLHR
jgi:hypothetical protein